MGGYVNLVIRQDGVIRKKLSYTGCVPAMFSAPFFEGKKSAVDKVFNMYGNNVNVTDPARGLLAPFDYGVIVVDYDTKQIFDMQNFACIYLRGRSFTHDDFDHIPDLFKRGWVGNGLVDIMTGEALPSFAFPEDIAKWEAGKIIGWLHSNPVDYGQDTDGHLVLSKVVMPALRIYPPDWKFHIFDKPEGQAMMDGILEAGFEFSPEELGVWKEWMAAHPANTTCKASEARL